MSKRNRRRNRSEVIKSKTFRTKQNTARASLSKPREAYTVSAIELSGTFTYAEARKEYTRLRAIANKRLQRLSQAGLTDTDIYRANVGKYPVLKSFNTPRELYQSLSSLSWFVSSNRSTVSGQRDYEQSIRDTLASNYGTPEDMDLKKFGNFMEFMRAKFSGKEYDSERSAKMYRESIKKGISPEQLKAHYNTFYKEVDRLAKMKNRVKGMDRDRTAKEFAGALRRRSKKRG